MRKEPRSLGVALSFEANNTLVLVKERSGFVKPN